MTKLNFDTSDTTDRKIGNLIWMPKQVADSLEFLLEQLWREEHIADLDYQYDIDEESNPFFECAETVHKWLESLPKTWIDLGFVLKLIVVFFIFALLLPEFVQFVDWLYGGYQIRVDSSG